MRVTQNSFIAQAARQARNRNVEILKLSEQLTSGLRILRPSDDPGVMGSLLANKSADRRMDIDLANIASARTRLNQGHSQLQSAIELMRSARDLAIEGTQSLEPDILGNSVNSILDQLFQIANSTDGGQPIFAGTATDGKAFEITRHDAQGRISAVEYTGVDQRLETIVAPGLTVDVLYGGNDVFGYGPQRDTQIRGVTGAKAGTGRDTATGTGQLLVEHDQTVFNGTLGIKAGTSTGSDTLIGFGNQLVIQQTSSGPTVQLNGGPPVAFSSASVDLPVTDENSRTVHLDMSDVPADASGATSVAGLGTLTIDGGLTKYPIDFTDNQELINPVTQEVTYVDSTEISRAGEASIHYGGHIDAFQSLVQLRDLMLHSDEVSTTEYQDQMEMYQGDLQVALDQMLEILGEQSVSLENLDRLETRTDESQLETRLAIGDAENSDPTEVILQLQQEQNLLQFIYASAAGAFDVSLLDFVR